MTLLQLHISQESHPEKSIELNIEKIWPYFLNLLIQSAASKVKTDSELLLWSIKVKPMDTRCHDGVCYTEGKSAVE